jgi:DNA-binding transcriptional ArsR family regulator
MTTAPDLTMTFAALGDPTRRAIVDRLADGDATVNELAGLFPITLQAVSRHIKVRRPAAS